MPKLTVIFDLPAHIHEGLKLGTYELFGGVVRNPQGQVVKHLAEVGRTVKKHNLRGTDLGKNLLIGVVVTAGIAAVATGSYYVGRFFDGTFGI